jgi:hypothetical protein
LTVGDELQLSCQVWVGGTNPGKEGGPGDLVVEEGEDKGLGGRVEISAEEKREEHEMGIYFYLHSLQCNRILSRVIAVLESHEETKTVCLYFGRKEKKTEHLT